MKIGLIGLGRMGLAIADRCVKYNVEVLGYDPSHQAQEDAEKLGVVCAKNIRELVDQVDIIWLMVGASLVDQVLAEIKPHIKKNGMIIIDGGNSNFHDSMRRAQELEKIDIDFLDCGTSGGLHGRQQGFCLMVGGKQEIYKKVEPIFQHVAMPGGYAYAGPSGAGHYVKMVHNGIEYALLQAYAQGMHILKDGSFKQQLDLENIANLWQHGSIIRSWILQLLADALHKNPDFNQMSGYLAESGMGKWTIEEAQQNFIPATLIEESLRLRFQSQQDGGNFATQLVALLRHEFGGHEIKKI